ncbi:MAG: hypothetical protein IPL26_00195 [Leptospiraceae bacterium]|nr:hypothetical protein [Leptospiraceae bacterium]
MNRTVDEGTDQMIETPVNVTMYPTQEEYDDTEINIGDEYEYEGETWTITAKYVVGKLSIPRFDLNRIVYTPVHIPLWVDYWHVYKYAFLEWNFLREQSRAAA